MPKLIHIVGIIVLSLCSLVNAKEGNPATILLEIKGPIGPATEAYLQKGFEYAKDKEASLIIIQMDTPGGLDSATRNIIQNILKSKIPVATYVFPSGARAASAGTYILYASHVAAMAPATSVGAATPIQISSPISPQENQKTKPTDTSTLEKKIVNDAVAFIKGLAELRQRNVEWAEKAVREAATLSAEEALSLKVIDFISDSVPELVKQISMTMKLPNQSTESFKPDWRTELLSIITNPTLAYILLIVGIYGIIFELMNPGLVLPGVVGVIALLLVLYAFQLLPVNYAGLALLAVGIGLVAGEFLLGTAGMLGAGGVVAFIVGSLLLFDPAVAGYEISRQAILMIAIINLAILFLIVKLALSSHKRKLVSGSESLLGATGTVLHDFEAHKGQIKVNGEIWQAESKNFLEKGQTVKITAVNNLTLMVEPVGE